jgi:hypothetical protein
MVTWPALPQGHIFWSDGWVLARPRGFPSSAGKRGRALLHSIALDRNHGQTPYAIDRGGRHKERPSSPHARRSAEGEGKMSPSRPARRPWTADERKKLDDLTKAGKIAAEIATALQRTPHSIYSQLQRLDIKRKNAARRLVVLGLKAKK